MKHPCYKKDKGIDCPNRHDGCAADCREWANYVKSRNDSYIKRHKDREIVYALDDMERARARRRK